MTIEPAPAGRRRRPRRSAGLTRASLLSLLLERDRPLSTHELAADLGLHPNSVREQLDRLVADGLARRVPAPPSGRGRPALRYLAIHQLDEAAPYRDLARALADELGRLPDPDLRAVSAGERWGRTTVRPATGAQASPAEASPAGARPAEGRPADASPADPTEALVAMLEAGGFAPEPRAEGEPIRLRRCPFGMLARERRSVVCGVHLGLLRGALAELGAPVEGVRLEPFVEPDLCLAHVGTEAGEAGAAGSRPPAARTDHRRRGTLHDARSTRA